MITLLFHLLCPHLVTHPHLVTPSALAWLTASGTRVKLASCAGSLARSFERYDWTEGGVKKCVIRCGYDQVWMCGARNATIELVRRGKQISISY